MVALALRSKILNVEIVEDNSSWLPDINRFHQQQSWLIDRLLLEKISLAGIVRATGVSERWLQYYVNKKLGAVKREVEVKSKKKGKLTIQCDKMWSFVGKKDNKQWIWLAIDASTKEIVEYILAKEIKLALKDYGIHCHQFIGNVP